MLKEDYKEKMDIVQHYAHQRPLEYESPSKQINELKTPEKKIIVIEKPIVNEEPPPTQIQEEPEPVTTKGKKGKQKAPLPKVPLKAPEPPKPRTPTPEPVPRTQLPAAEFIKAIQ